MLSGDLIRWEGQVWVVRKIDTGLAAAFVESKDWETKQLYQEVALAASEVWCHPARDWPFVTLPAKRPGSRLVGVEFQGRALQRLVDWMRVDELQIGGLLFLNPALKLGYRDCLVAVFSAIGPNGPGVTETVRLQVPRSYGSQTEKMARTQQAETKAKPAEPDIYSLLRDDE